MQYERTPYLTFAVIVVLEAIDALDAVTRFYTPRNSPITSTGWRGFFFSPPPVTKSRYQIDCKLSIVDADSGVHLQSFSTATHLYVEGALDFKKEEFIFPNVESTLTLRAQLLAIPVGGSGSMHGPTAIGHVDIPLFRLEEDTPVCL